MEDINIINIINEIASISKKYAMFGIKDDVWYRCLISSIFLKRQMKLTKVIRQANDLLKDKCEEKNFQFVCNDNVTTEYEWRDGIHLNNERTRIFVGKFVYYLNDFILSKSI